MNRVVNNRSRIEIRRDLRKNKTPQEEILWSKLRNRKTGSKWRRQVSIGPYVADFYCREKLLAIEIDGSHHLINKEYDQDREKYFSKFGIKTMRFWNNDIDTNIEKVIGVITSAPLAFPGEGPGVR